MIDFSDITNPLRKMDEFNRKVYIAQNHFTGNDGAPMYNAHMDEFSGSNIEDTESDL
jgi:hypothetical protein